MEGIHVTWKSRRNQKKRMNTSKHGFFYLQFTSQQNKSQKEKETKERKKERKSERSFDIRDTVNKATREREREIITERKYCVEDVAGFCLVDQMASGYDDKN